MAQLRVVSRDGGVRIVDGEIGSSVMEILRDGDFDELLALCGGTCSCATCHVYVDPEFVDRIAPMSDAENELLSISEHRGEFSRLSCQLVFHNSLDGLTVKIAPED